MARRHDSDDDDVSCEENCGDGGDTLEETGTEHSVIIVINERSVWKRPHRKTAQEKASEKYNGDSTGGRTNANRDDDGDGARCHPVVASGAV